MNSRVDTNRQRLRQASRPLSAAMRHLAPYPRLHLYRVDMPPGLTLYAPDTSSTARALVGQTVPGPPARWKMERGWGGNLHLHIISPLPPLAVPGAAHHAPVYDLRGLLAYLSKPAPAELCAPGRLTPWTPDPYTRARAYRDALDEYGAVVVDHMVSGDRHQWTEIARKRWQVIVQRVGPNLSPVATPLRGDEMAGEWSYEIVER